MDEKPSDLNDAQWQAVNHDGGHLLIVAGPGTGKTHTLTHRIARLVKDLGTHDVTRIANINDEQFGLRHVSPNLPRILAITFTNKAAEQMRQRLAQREVDLETQVFVGTFHRFCLHLLRRHIESTALPKSFRVVLPEEIDALVKDLWPNKTTAQRKESLEQISILKSTHLVFEPTVEFKEYQRLLHAKELIDFDDILREALILLDANEELAAQVRAQFPHICVDEYQDINMVQNAFLKILAAGTNTLTAIGDPHQSIYGFRGSEVKLFHRFTEDFSGATMLYLNENYRACRNLITASSQVIGKAAANKDFELIAKIYEEGRLVIHQADTDRAEGDYIATQIEKLIGGMDMRSSVGGHHSFGDFAILYRLNAQRHVVAQALAHLGIPYQVSAKPARVTDYSDDAALGQYEEAVDYNVEKVSLMTLHAAKGLEFPIVFIIGCEEHLLPLDIEGMTGDQAEERRLFYVGMTRAKECLYLTRANRRQLFGKTFEHDPSPFLADIQETLKAYEATRVRKKAKAVTVDDGQMKLF